MVKLVLSSSRLDLRMKTLHSELWIMNGIILSRGVLSVRLKEGYWNYTLILRDIPTVDDEYNAHHTLYYHLTGIVFFYASIKRLFFSPKFPIKLQETQMQANITWSMYV